MLEDRGILDALSASKEFSQGRMETIFGLVVIAYLSPLIPSLLTSARGVSPGIVEAVFGIVGLIGVPEIAETIFWIIVGLIVAVYESITSSYLYIQYGGLRVTPLPPPTPVTSAPVSPTPKIK